MAEKKTKSPTAKKGRPTLYTNAKADLICKLRASGKTLKACCEEVGIGVTTLWDWQVAHKSFSERLAHANEVFYEVLADEILEISNRPEESTVVEEIEAPEGFTRKEKTFDDVSARRLKIETRLKLLGKWKPDKYGDKVKAEVTTTQPVRVVFANDLED